MNKHLKIDLLSTYDAPPPVNKDAFLNNLPYPKTKPYEFLLNQLGYIRLRIWVCSLLIFITTLMFIASNHNDENFYKITSIISSLLPLLALLLISELARSLAYQMAELEMTTKYNLSEIILSRLIHLGTMNLLMYLVIAFVLSEKLEYSFIKAGIYLTVPYLLTSAASLAVLRIFKSREALYICSIFCMLIIFLCTETPSIKQVLYQDQLFSSWVILFILLIFTTFILLKNFITKSEEFYGTYN